MVISAICQRGMIEAGGAKSAIDLLVTDGHWREAKNERQGRRMRDKETAINVVCSSHRH